MLCVDCGTEIPLARLMAVPNTETCRPCQELRDIHFHPGEVLVESPAFAEPAELDLSDFGF